MMTSLSLRIVLESLGKPFLKQSCAHMKAPCPTWDEKVFPEGKVFHACRCGSSRVPRIFWRRIRLSWNGGGLIRRPQSVVHVKHFSLVTSWLCFLGARSADQVALRMGPMVLVKVYVIVLNTMKNTRTLRDHFLLQYTIYWRDRLTRRRLVSHGVLNWYSPHLSSP